MSSLLKSSLGACLALFAVLAFAASAQASSSEIVSAERIDDTAIFVTVSTTYDGCVGGSNCSWTPVAYSVPAGSPCPSLPTAAAYVATGETAVGNGLQEYSGTVSSASDDPQVCSYVSTSNAYVLIAAIPMPTLADDDGYVETLYFSEARYFTRRFLRNSRWKYGYNRGVGFRQRCHRVSRTKIRCSVRWRYKGRYVGYVSHRAYVDNGDQMISSRANIKHHKPKKKKRGGSGGGSRGNCDSSYPTVCIPPPPPDLDCPEIPYQDFAVTGSDPHGFDGDRDGIGCES